MGTQYRVYCQQCGYDATLDLGVGFVYPEDFAEMQEKGRSGKFGDEIRVFFVEQPKGVMDSELVIGKCNKCGEYYSVPLTQMYIPKSSGKLRDMICAVRAVMPFYKMSATSFSGLSSNYRLYKTHLPPCEKCGGDIKMFREKDIGKLSCPHCGKRFLTPEISALWD